MHCNYGAVHSSHQPKATQQTDPAQQFEPVAIVSCSGGKCSGVHGQAAFPTLHAAHNHNTPDVDDIKHECFFVESRYLDVDRPDLMPARLKRNVLEQKDEWPRHQATAPPWKKGDRKKMTDQKWTFG